MWGWIMAGFCVVSAISCLVMSLKIKSLLEYQEFLEAKIDVLEKMRDVYFYKEIERLLVDCFNGMCKNKEEE